MEPQSQSKPQLAADRWFATEATAPDAVAQLFCLPHAGAGASTYRDWQALIGADVEVVPVQLPGREARFAEPLVTSAAELVGALAGPLLERADKPFALFGHSMGALLAYELAHELVRLGRPPVHLVVSGYVAPQLPRHPLAGLVHKLPDDRVVRHIEALQGTAGEVLEHPDLLQLLLPVIRADYELCETHRFVERPPLPVPVTALGGTDDPGVGDAALQGWRELTAADFGAESFPGGHFFLHEQLDEVTGIVRGVTLSESSRT
ncbi:alpha/beta fold hydrolase [Streptomyces atratus]|uniref:Surfactin synthase thioesterase subunit n=1 Tax=Streptomyces atratus TaxID=1893 RepID=A0A1K2EYJ0_STRAR|nr:alpha/beta fold hydrolase [Streptomyces atratus]SFY40060.1 Surfactin synthase thioesterase subunit [Streptomyces atratus]